MKRLKFMLAAAAAIGLTTASQATDYNGSTDFEAFTVGATADSTMSSYFDFTGASGDNESTIVGESVNFAGDRPAQFRNSADTKYLKVSTGTDPLLCKIGSAPETISEGGSIYVDTLVQFTATPATDEVVANAGDKLMIYVQNVTNENGDVTGNELKVKTADYKPADDLMGIPESLTTNDIVLASSFDITKWYRLTVKSFVADGLLQFNIYLDGERLQSTMNLHGVDTYAFPSLLGTSNTQLAGVGFAGEGAVDELSFTTDAFPTALDFTLVWPAGITPVGYTIGTATLVPIDGTATSPLHIAPIAGDTVRFSFQNADGASKVMELVAASDATSIDASTATFTWADYLGAAVDGAYEIDNLAELKRFQKGISVTTNELKLATAGETFKLTADIALDEAWPGIGVQNGKDIYSTDGFNAAAFQGTFDGQNHTISGFQMVGGGLDYCGFFNSTYGATIQNLKIQYAGSLFAADTAQNSSLESGATFVGVAKNSTLRNLTTLVGTVSCDKGFGGIVGYLTSGTLVESCTNNVNMTSLKPNKCGGIAMITQGGSAVTIRNCQNNGTIAGSGETGSLIGYIGLATTITDCDSTVAYKLFHHQSSTVTLSGVKGNATVVSYTGAATPGLNFATVDGDVATFVADNALAAGNTYKVMNAAATATYEFTAAGTIAFDTALATPSYAITSAAGLAAPKSATADGVTTYWVPSYAAEHPWYEAPAAVVLAENLPGQTGNIVSAFHGQGEGEYLGLTYSTNPLRFDLYQVDGTNALTAVYQIPTSDYATAGFRGVAISKTLGIVMTLSYTDGNNKMYVFPLAGGGNGTAVTLSDSIAFDAAAFSPDGRYLFSNSVTSPNTTYYKWMVSNGGTTLTKVGAVTASGRGRSLAYARINGRDLVFGLVDTGKIAVIDMTGDTVASWTATDMITDLPAHSYGTLCVSGVNTVDAEGNDATPHLTVATSTNNGATKADVLNVYALSVPATGTVTASRTKSFDEDALTEAGFGDISDANRYGNTVYVTDDETTIYFARPDNKLYAAQYAAPAPAGWVDDSSTITAGTTAAQQYPALADSALATADAKKLTDWAKSNNVAFTDATTTPAAYVDAFMLNCEPNAAAVAEAEEDFKLDITFDENGAPVVTVPTGYNVTPQLKGSNDLTNWTDVNAASSSYKFYKCVLSL